MYTPKRSISSGCREDGSGARQRKLPQWAPIALWFLLAGLMIVSARGQEAESQAETAPTPPRAIPVNREGTIPRALPVNAAATSAAAAASPATPATPAAATVTATAAAPVPVATETQAQAQPQAGESASGENAADVGKDVEKDRERLTQLQIFLDNANFGPGKIDGRWGEFTRKALTRYIRNQGGTAPEFTDEVPQDFGVDPSVVSPVYTSYTITQADADALGSVPEEPEDKAKMDAMPYEDMPELIGERFHADRDYVKELNPESKFAVGDTVKVPNVARPFVAEDVKSTAQKKKDEEKAKKAEDKEGDAQAADGDGEKKEGEKAADGGTPGEPSADSMANADKEGSKEEGINAEKLLVDTGTKMLEVFQGGKLVAAFPVTPGSEATPAPKGEWKIESLAYKPDFRHDESMLKKGVRSDDAHIIPPGPNNAVGVIWIALNKDGIGIHGTAEPDLIGRNASSGCIRLANWDVVELAKMVKHGVPVTIQ